MNIGVFKNICSFMKGIVFAPRLLEVEKCRKMHTLCKTLPSSSTLKIQNIPKSFDFLTASLPLINHTCGIKVRVRLARKCKACYFVSIDGILHNLCTAKGSHVHRIPKKRFKNTWIWTFCQTRKKREW